MGEQDLLVEGRLSPRARQLIREFAHGLHLEFPEISDLDCAERSIVIGEYYRFLEIGSTYGDH